MKERPLPSHVYAEKVVLGILLNRSDRWFEFCDILSAADFTLDDHRRIWAKMEKLGRSGESFNGPSVAAEFVKDDPDGGQFIATITEIITSVPDLPNLKSYVGLVREATIRRELMAAAAEMMNQASDPSVDLKELSESTGKRIQDATGRLAGKLPLNIGQIIEREGGINSFVSKSQYGAVPFPWPSLQERTGGMLPGEVFVIAAETGGGKTAFLSQLAQGTARHGFGTLVFSLEMTDVSLACRHIASAGALNSRVFRHGDPNPDEINRIMEGATAVADLPLFIDDRASLTAGEIVSTARRLRNQHPLHLIAVDYLQLMSAKGENMTARISNISRGVKMAAMSLKVPVIALCQFSRPPKGVKVERSLQDLFGSSSLEKDSSCVLFLEGDTQYESSPYEWLQWELKCKKFRDGATSGWSIPMLWQKATGRFMERSERSEAA